MRTKTTTDCPLTGLARMQSNCEICLKPIIYLKYNHDGAERVRPRFHQGSCAELGTTIKAERELKKEQLTREADRQQSLEWHVTKKGKLFDE